MGVKFLLLGGLVTNLPSYAAHTKAMDRSYFCPAVYKSFNLNFKYILLLNTVVIHVYCKQSFQNVEYMFICQTSRQLKQTGKTYSCFFQNTYLWLSLE